MLIEKKEKMNFLETVREKNPDFYIICILGTLNPKGMYFSRGECKIIGLKKSS
jgi:hypothetical protein